jgi:hypothetical protein
MSKIMARRTAAVPAIHAHAATSDVPADQAIVPMRSADATRRRRRREGIGVFNCQ